MVGPRSQESRSLCTRVRTVLPLIRRSCLTDDKGSRCSRRAAKFSTEDFSIWIRCFLPDLILMPFNLPDSRSRSIHRSEVFSISVAFAWDTYLSLSWASWVFRLPCRTYPAEKYLSRYFSNASCIKASFSFSTRRFRDG